MATFVSDGIVRMVGTGDSFGGPGDPIEVQSIILTSDKGATTNTVLTVQTNDPSPITLFEMQSGPLYNTEQVIFDPPRAFSSGIRIALSATGGAPDGTDDCALVLA